MGSKKSNLHSKKTFSYAEADQTKREKFLEEIKDIDPAMIVYSDETGIDDNEVTLRGWAPEGERCHFQKKAERTTRYNITAALNLNFLFVHSFLKVIQIKLFTKHILNKC